MKRILSVVSAVAVLAVASAASAQVIDDNSVVTFGGSVTPQCNISGAGGHVDINAAVPGGLINADGFLNWTPNTNFPLGTLSGFFGNVWCNSAGASIELSLERLTSSNGPSGGSSASNWAGGGFDHEITVMVTGLGFTPVNATPGGQVMPVLQGPALANLNPGNDQESRTFTAGKWFYGQINGNIGMFNDPTRRPIAGDYTGSLTLTVTPTS